jgi:hypothetical protein
VSSVGDLNGVGTGVAHGYLAEVMIARIAFKILCPCGCGRQPAE